MPKSFTVLLGAVFGLAIICVTILLALGKDPTILMTLITASVIPTIPAMFSAKNSARAVHNTNGRMTELIQTIQQMGGTVPPGYEDVTAHVADEG